MSDFLREIVSDKEVEDCFHGTNFGSAEPREVIADTLLKLHCDYSTGSTAMKIAHELGLIGKTRKLTKKGRYYLFWAYTDRKALSSADVSVGDVRLIEIICRRLHSQAYCNENVDNEWRDFEDDAKEILSDIRRASTQKPDVSGVVNLLERIKLYIHNPFEPDNQSQLYKDISAEISEYKNGGK